MADVGVPAPEADDIAPPQDDLSLVVEDTPPDFGAGVVTELAQECRVEQSPVHDSTWVAGADYLLLRPSFGNSTALLLSTRSGGPGGAASLDSINYDFGYSGGVRAFLGYQASPEHVFRFTYTSFFAQTSASGNATGN
ncbi:hypothetical protein EBS80_04220, partial [bacterium]|nr:hypothetical protein [bacterium]